MYSKRGNAYLDSPDSATYLNDSLPHGWLPEPAVELLKLYEFEVAPIPRSFNAFFHRQIKKQFRSVDQPGNPQVIVSANDGTVVRWAQVNTPSADFTLKGQPYSLDNMLSDPSDKTWKPQGYVERFVGGHVFQTFLSGANYHRWWAPIAGTVVEAPRIVPGLMFSELPNAGWDPTAGTHSQGYEASVNTRGLLFIESDHMTDDGQKMLVCLMPIGITEISSVAFVNAKGQPVKKGDRVEKGTELGRFSYGGSSMCLLFSKGVIDKFVTPRNTGATMDDGPPVFVGIQIAVTRKLHKPQ
ncbi:phosphatidylserine decarboxylase [Streptomyces milbemycinicus]|uniref:phosphatidylserine decarboxylase n=1 Tax=Streptomyces milbemycinicus TaxID=476552 RepID=UPI0034007496